MRLLLKQCRKMELDHQLPPKTQTGDELLLSVSFCAVCRTDAKMWREGHRDLALPRVPGHEFVGRLPATGQTFVAWPGIACNSCRYCRGGRENLCDDMRILGFHADGGFARQVRVLQENLIEADLQTKEHLLTFAEPIACVLGGLEPLHLVEGERLLVYGGGVMGMLAALAGLQTGCRVTVIERSAEKIARLAAFAETHRLEIVKDTTVAEFDAAMNCCDSHMAFCQALTKVRKGGRISFFSGLQKRQELESGLLNLIHYRELAVHGSYGPRRSHMAAALGCIADWQRGLPLLIEKIIEPAEVEAAFTHVLSGDALKYIVDFQTFGDQQQDLPTAPAARRQRSIQTSALSPLLQELIGGVQPVESRFEPAARRTIDQKTKPLGALGRVEELAVQLAVIQQSLTPRVDNKRLFVFAGDHGVVDEGVSAFPAKVTVQMVENFLAGGAAINAFCRQYAIDLKVVDMGVNGHFSDHPQLLHHKVAAGTANLAVRPAMTRSQALQALENGARAFLEQQRPAPCQIVGMGEMGIGNTSSATAIICAATGLAVRQGVGRGTGVDDEGLRRKCEVIDRALRLHQPAAGNGLELLETLGGFELGGIAGATLAAAGQGCCVVLDGIISTAAGLIAYLLCPEVAGYLVSGHRSVERGQQAALELMGLSPVIDLDFRLGEGTGAAVTINLAELACRIMREMASFNEAGVDSGSI